MPFRVLCNELTVVNLSNGLPRHCFRGNIIPFLNADERELFLRNRLIEEIRDPGKGNGAPEPELVDENGAIVAEAVADLDRLGLPAAAGAPRCRAALRENGSQYSNAVIAAAVRVRKERAAAVPGS
jgi:cytochrome c oxidase cbb3-type subunit II